MENIIFGPVPSRRLGKSLGINNIPPKICSYGCVYCQIGVSVRIQSQRQKFYDPQIIINQAQKAIEQLKKEQEKIDYISIVPDGEPLLDLNLGKLIIGLKQFGYPVAVISNATLLWDSQASIELTQADLVSLKIDAITEQVWRRINKPHKDLNLDKILNGISSFSAKYQGTLYTETMLVKNRNDDQKEIQLIAEFIGQLSPHIAFISIPTRPPAENIKPAEEQIINYAYQQFKKNLENVELLTGTDPGEFGASKDPLQEILAITSVHPMSFEALDKFLIKHNIKWIRIQEMIDNNQLIETKFNGKKFYIRKIKKNKQL